MSVSLPASLLQEVPDVVDLLRLQHTKSEQGPRTPREESTERPANPAQTSQATDTSGGEGTAKERGQHVGALSTHNQDTNGTAHIHFQPPPLDGEYTRAHTPSPLSCHRGKFGRHTPIARGPCGADTFMAPPFAKDSKTRGRRQYEPESSMQNLPWCDRLL